MFKLRLWIFQIHAVTVPNILFIICFPLTNRKSNHTRFQATQGEVESLGGDPKRLEGVEGGIPRYPPGTAKSQSSINNGDDM